MRSIIVTSILLTLFHPCFATWYNDETSKATVLIEKQIGDSFYVHGAGVLLYNYNNIAKPIVITNHHIVKRPEICVSITADTSLVNLMNKYKVKELFFNKTKWLLRGTRLYCTIKTGYPNKPMYFIHPDTTIDLAAFPIDIASSFELENGFIAKVNYLGVPKSGIRIKDSVSIGDEVYFLGFPISYGSTEKITPIVRSGSVACFNPNGKEFILDAFSFGGNSGGPIFTKSIINKPGNLTWDSSQLIGLVYGHHGISELLLKPLADSIPITISLTELQNMGLVRCIWANDILIVYNLAIKNTK